MAKNRNNIRVYGSDNGAVYVANKGTIAPNDLGAPASDWTELGWLSDSGLELEQKADQKSFNAWQGGAIVKVVTSGAERTFTFECLEETAFVLGLAYGGVSFTNTGTGAATVATGTVKGAIKTMEKALIIDTVDSTDGYIKRYRIPVGVIDPSSKVVHKYDDLTVYSFSVTVTGDFDIVSNSPSITGVTTP